MFDKSCRGKSRMLKFKHGEPNLACIRTMCNIAQEANAAADALSRVFCAIGCPGDLFGLHESLGHPGITGFWHFFRSKNLPFDGRGSPDMCAVYHVLRFETAILSNAVK